jgi:Arc/MetJ-type ribon-helix-helix transcriptional regulator
MVRKRVSITLPKECLEWIDSEVRNRTYGNRSHAIEVLILGAMKQAPTLIIDSEKAARLHKKEKKEKKE